MVIQITIKGKTPTVNHLYSTNKWGRMFMTVKARQLKTKITEDTKKQAEAQHFDIKKWKNKLLKVRVEIHENWWTKKGKVYRKDIANKEKFLVDAVMEGIGIDDSFIWEHIMVKKDSEEFKSVITIEKWTPGPLSAGRR